MNRRILGKTGESVSLLGLGTMRLPLLVQPDGSTDYDVVDEQAAIRLIRQSIDSGINYIDTARYYHQGNSEIVLGKALQDGYLERTHIATKLPVWATDTYADFERMLDEQLANLQTDSIDFYLLHALDEDTWPKVEKLNVGGFLEQARRKGKIRHVGFSFHDQLPAFKNIVNSYDWEFCQIQLNILDAEYQAGLEGMRYAAERGLGVIVMEPLRGGSLASQIPPDIQAIWEKAELKRSPAEWAFRWLSDLPEVSLILSGMSNTDQLEDNLRILSDAQPNTLNPRERELIQQVRNEYGKLIKVGCTNCQYCLPCPSGVAIPDVFRMYNGVYLFYDLDGNKHQYRNLIDKNQDATACIACGQCESICPQHLQIISQLKEADSVLR